MCVYEAPLQTAMDASQVTSVEPRSSGVIIEQTANCESLRLRHKISLIHKAIREHENCDQRKVHCPAGVLLFAASSSPE